MSEKKTGLWGLPTWMPWTCGGGCLLAIAVAITLGVLGVRAAKKIAEDMRNPTVQWAAIAPALPHEQPPEDWTIQGMKIPFVDFRFWTLEEEGGDLHALVVQSANPDALRAVRRGEAQGRANGDQIGWDESDYDAIDGSLVVGPKDLACVRLYDRTGGENGDPRAWVVMLTSAEVESQAILFFSTKGERRTVPEGELVEFLMLFDVGSMR